MIRKIFAFIATLPVATLGMAGVALADDGAVIVSNSNSAAVINVVTSSANSGSNVANGGGAGDAGDGGSVISSDDDNMGGNGGNAGNGGTGGSITTGDAAAYVTVTNDINYNKTKVDFCGCEKEEHEDLFVKVKNENHAFVKNKVVTGADSGYNMADGSSAGNGGTGGDVVSSDNGNMGGNGGIAGNGGAGGRIGTGVSVTDTKITSLVNTNITRIRR